MGTEGQWSQEASLAAGFTLSCLVKLWSSLDSRNELEPQSWKERAGSLSAVLSPTGQPQRAAELAAGWQAAPWKRAAHNACCVYRRDGMFPHVTTLSLQCRFAISEAHSA